MVRGELKLLYIGIIFILIGLYSIFEDFYDFKASFQEKELVKLENVLLDGFYKVKAMLGLFCMVIGLFSIINYFYY